MKPKLRYLNNDDELKAESRRIQNEIDKINRALTEDEKNAVLMDPDDMDPMGYDCTKEVLEINEITYLDQLLCFNTTEEQCYKVRLLDIRCCIICAKLIQRTHVLHMHFVLETASISEAAFIQGAVCL